MSRYDGLIIPRSYSEYINKTDAATLQQALQLNGVLSGTVQAGDNKAVKSSAVYAEISKTKDFWNLRVKAATPTTATTETLHNSRKFSDYYWILIDVGTGAYNTRETLLIPSLKVMQGSTFYVFTTISGNREEVDIEILSDTQLKISSTSNTAYTGIYGFIVK